MVDGWMDGGWGRMDNSAQLRLSLALSLAKMQHFHLHYHERKPYLIYKCEIPREGKLVSPYSNKLMCNSSVRKIGFTIFNKLTSASPVDFSMMGIVVYAPIYLYRYK